MSEPGPAARATRRVVVGTAGHIDHGKTSLVEALTGVDCDRFAEEKERGITIDLGFAHLVEGDLQLGFVDVPGHERFVANALAGLGGIDLMVLVVAADEGVKPQTREHLAICSLLRIPAGLVALTKVDLVDADLAEIAELELAEELDATSFADVPIVRVSSRTGEGIEDFRRQLFERARAIDDAPLRLDRPARLPVDRSFHLRGLGVLVTGTLASGRIGVGDPLELRPSRALVRVRSVQVHGDERPQAVAGERTALQLSGVGLDQVERGAQLIAPDSIGESRSLCARLKLLPEAETLSGPVEIRFHLYADDVLGRLRPLSPPVLQPGATGLVEIRLRRPITTAWGDRFILRRPSPAATVAGGEILDPDWKRPRGTRLQRSLDVMSALEAPGDTAGGGDVLPGTLRSWIAAAREGGLETDSVARRLGLDTERVRRHLEALGAEVVRVSPGQGHGERWLPAIAGDRVAKRAQRVLTQYFTRNRLARGMPRAEALSQILPGRAAQLADHYLEQLREAGVVAELGDLLGLPGRGDDMTGEESKLARDIVDAFRAGGLAPPSPPEICRSLGAKPQIFDGVVRYLHDRGRLTRLPQGLFVATETVEELVEALRATGWESFDVGRFKDRFAVSRKWAIPLMEHLDMRRVTVRDGNERRILPSP